jgi:membrane protein DedA with SNARE-associated domain
MNIAGVKVSKKLAVTVFTSIFVIVNELFGLSVPDETIMTISGLAASYVVGQSFVDGKEKES